MNMKKRVKLLQCNTLEWAWQPPKSFPIPISLIFSKDPALLLEVGPLITHSTFIASDYVYDHIFNYSKEHMLMLIHLRIVRNIVRVRSHMASIYREG